MGKRKSRSQRGGSTSDFHVFYIVGLGCDPNAQKSTASFHYECNASLSSTLETIAKTVCYMKPNKKDKFIIKNAMQVGKLLDDNSQVLLLGHSYGGAVATVIADILNSHPAVHNLQVATFGSIFTIDPATIPNIKIRQFMKLKDVALNCNKLQEPSFSDYTYEDTRQHITWIRNKYEKGWDNHNSYADIIMQIREGKDVMTKIYNLE
jgi:hypothetical protein